VAADLSTEGLEEIEHEEAVESSMAEDTLRKYEIEMGLATPETTVIPESTKQLGPRQTEEN
jgi:hypothetical protein